jgi:hypothetical protein
MVAILSEIASILRAIENVIENEKAYANEIENGNGILNDATIEKPMGIVCDCDRENGNENVTPYDCEHGCGSVQHLSFVLFDQHLSDLRICSLCEDRAQNEHQSQTGNDHSRDSDHSLSGQHPFFAVLVMGPEDLFWVRKVSAYVRRLVSFHSRAVFDSIPRVPCTRDVPCDISDA